MDHNHPMLRTVLKSQYHASLAMLREAVERCPAEEWVSTGHKNAFWQVSYHALFFAHLYLQRDEAAFRPWEQHRSEADGIDGEPYTLGQVLEYWEYCDRMVDEAVDGLDLDRTESGFSWYRMSKLEHQFVNIRHIQHHGAQLIDRVRSTADVRDSLGRRACFLAGFSMTGRPRTPYLRSSASFRRGERLH